jgi:fatty acid desaturase
MDVRYLLLKRQQRDGFFGKSCREWIVVVLIHLTLLIMHPKKFVLYVFLPHICAQWGIVTMNMLQHDGCDTNIDTDNRFDNYNTSRNFVGSFVNYLTFNNGYHAIHHMYPRMHWSRLREEHELQVKPKCNPNLNEKCMVSYIYRTFVYPGLRLDYLGNPVIPLVDNEPDLDWVANHME